MARRSRTEARHHGILLVDKPQGWTSHDVVARVRGLAGQRQIGHTGTLDPLATGLLVLCLGRATRLVEYMAGHDKAYEGTIRLGVATTTDDAEGETVQTAQVPPLTPEVLSSLEASFTGRIDQIPPAFSAVKIGGQRAYAVARKGGVPAMAPRPVTIHRLRLDVADPDTLSVSVECGSGTFVRSLARDIGRDLGSAAHLASLRRTRVGPFDIRGAWTLDQLRVLAAAGQLRDAAVPPDEGVTELAAAILQPSRAAQVAHGERVQVAAEGPLTLARVYDSGGEFVAVGRIGDDRRLQPLKVFTL